MKTVHKSVLIWYSPQEMYVLVTNVQQYPQFLPWCDYTKIIKDDGAGMTAEIGLSISGVRQTFTTRNIHSEPTAVDMQLVDGPFSHLDGQWSFQSLGDGTERACKVTLTLNYGFDNSTLGKLVAPVFDKIADSLVDAFVRRAEQVYGT